MKAASLWHTAQTALSLVNFSASGIKSPTLPNSCARRKRKSSGETTTIRNAISKKKNNLSLKGPIQRGHNHRDSAVGCRFAETNEIREELSLVNSNDLCLLDFFVCQGFFEPKNGVGFDRTHVVSDSGVGAVSVVASILDNLQKRKKQVQQDDDYTTPNHASLVGHRVSVDESEELSRLSAAKDPKKRSDTPQQACSTNLT